MMKFTNNNNNNNNNNNKNSKKLNQHCMKSFLSRNKKMKTAIQPKGVNY